MGVAKITALTLEIWRPSQAKIEAFRLLECGSTAEIVILNEFNESGSGVKVGL